MIIPYNGIYPKIAKSAFIAPNATIIGDVEIGENCTILFGAVLRGDINKIIIGNNSNVQDNSVVHTTRNLSFTVVGENVTIGHNCTIHGCNISNNVIVGMGSTLLDLASINSNSIIGANSLITLNKNFNNNKLILGNPAKEIRDLTEQEVNSILDLANSYVLTGNQYKANMLN